MRLVFVIRIETSVGWQYLSNKESWYSTTLHETLAGAGSVNELSLTKNVLDARQRVRRGVSTAHNRVVRALSECCLTQSVVARFSDTVEINQVSSWQAGKLAAVK